MPRLLISLSGALAAALLWALPISAAFPGKNGRIFFTGVTEPPNSRLDIFSINPDGSDVEQLANPLGRSIGLGAVSPVGKLAFTGGGVKH